MLRWVFPELVTTTLAAASTLGREPTCDTVLPGSEVSRLHARIERDGPLSVIADAGSRNGVSVNGERVREAPLVEGDVVRIGEWVGVVTAEDEAGPFREISPGWMGGALLASRVEPARRLAPTETPVLLHGATGTGKEGLARAIHGWSGRRGPFVAVNCAAIAPSLVEAELFGYRRGAFTGADRPSPGVLRAAEGGTLLLDEIQDLPLEAQAKLLRVLDQHEVHPIGEPRPVQVDVRFVAATQESLATAVAAKRFRPDLLARIDGVTIDLPTLRERRVDVAPLFLHLVRDMTGGRPPKIDARLVESLCLRDWPLNVRELVVLTRRLVSLHGHEARLAASHLPPRGEPAAAPRAERTSPASPRAAPRASVRDADQFAALVGALDRHGGSVGAAAAELGITRFRAYRLLHAHPEFTWRRDPERR